MSAGERISYVVTTRFGYIGLLVVGFAGLILLYGMTFYKYYPDFAIMNLMAFVMLIGGLAFGILVGKWLIDKQFFEATLFLKMIASVLLSILAINFIGLALPMALTQPDVPYDQRVFVMLMGVVEEVLFLFGVYPLFIRLSHSRLAAAIGAMIVFAVYHYVVYFHTLNVLPWAAAARGIFIVAYEFNDRRVDGPMLAHVINNFLSVKPAGIPAAIAILIGGM